MWGRCISGMLLANGADPNMMINDWRGRRTALYGAVFGGHEVTARLLLENHANDALKDSYTQETALDRTVLQRDENMARLLLEYGADTQMKDLYGKTALFMAAVYGWKEVLQLFLDKGADIGADKLGFSFLKMAAMLGHIDIVDLLIDRGTEVNTVLMDCLWDRDREEMVKFLLMKGADANMQSSRTGMTPLLIAAHLGYSIEAMHLLVGSGANLEAKDKLGRTSLLCAAGTFALAEHWLAKIGGKNRKELVQFLLENGANIEATDNLGRTAFDFAADNEPLVQLLRGWKARFGEVTDEDIDEEMDEETDKDIEETPKEIDEETNEETHKEALQKLAKRQLKRSQNFDDLGRLSGSLEY